LGRYIDNERSTKDEQIQNTMTPLFKKLNYKEQKEIIAINAPKSFTDELTSMKSNAKIVTDLNKASNVEFAICFLTTQPEIDDFISKVDGKVNGDATIWICYPKSSSKKYACDFNRDTGFSAVGKYGFEPVRQVAIDEDWSSLRFRKVKFIKKITRKESFAMTNEAKQRTTKKGQ
jgi:hypothetical protein